MLGFLPGMAYLGDVPGELALPRRETPRLKVPAGSLAIATTDDLHLIRWKRPAGWHLIGRSPVPFLQRRPRPARAARARRQGELRAGFAARI